MPTLQTWIDRLTATRAFRIAATRAPRFVPGRMLHRAGLRAMSAGAWRTAERLFEAAGERYRIELRVVPLARVRVHQLMARARAAARHNRDPQLEVEAERRLCRLDAIEAPWPPFTLVEAASLLAGWIDDQRGVATTNADVEPPSATALDESA
jgi:hypothetical protein